MTTEDSSTDTFVSHLIELRTRLMRAVGAILVVFVVLFLYPGASAIYDILAAPMLASLPTGTTMIATGVITPFIVAIMTSPTMKPGHKRGIALGTSIAVGLITAVALVRPSRSLYDLQASSVRKKWKDKSFAAGADRDIIQHGAQEFGVDLWTHVDFAIIAMRKIAKELDLEGNLPAPETSG